MRCIIPVNHVAEMRPEQTTMMIAQTAARRGHDVWLVSVAQMGFAYDEVVARAIRVPSGTVEHIAIGDGAVMFMRTNPGRDHRAWAHETALELAALAEERGTVVMNSPRALGRAGSKLYLASLPEQIRPRTLATRDPRTLRDFIEHAPGEAVVKPARGTRGQDVFRVRRDSDNMSQIIDVVTRDGFAIAQDYVEQAVDGDIRLLLLHGEPIVLDGKHCVVRRVPPAHDFRSNVAIGGRPAPAEWSDTLQRIADLAGPRLVEDGIALAGLDVIGDRVVEANVFSPGGLHDANRFSGLDYTTPIIDALEAAAG